MSIAFSCPSCDADVKVRDELQGRKIKCPECREVVKVPKEIDDEDEEPRRRDDEEEHDRPRKKTRPTRSEDDDAEDRPRKKSRAARDEDEDDDDDARPRRMSHQEKVDYYIKDLKRRGVARNTAAPPLFRMLWAMGIPIPPPLFLGFLPALLMIGIPAGVFWGIAMWVMQWKGTNISTGMAIAGAAAFGLMFGSCVGFYLVWKANSLKLPPWSVYPNRAKSKRSGWWILGPIAAGLALLGIGCYFAFEVVRMASAGGGNAGPPPGLAEKNAPALPKGPEEESPRSTEVNILISNGRVTRDDGLFWPVSVDYRITQGDPKKIAVLILKIKARDGKTVDILMNSIFGLAAEGKMQGQLILSRPFGKAKAADPGPFEAWVEMPRSATDIRRVRVSDTITIN